MQEPLGRKKLLDFLKSAKRNNKINHSYIFCGEKGMGKKTICDYFVSLIMCKTDTLCGVCNACVQNRERTNPDVIYISDDGKSSIGVEKIRELIKEAHKKPVLSEKKIFVINNAQKMSISAQNALLKIIEEPLSYAVFIFLAEDKSALLPTVISRSVVIDIPPMSADEILSCLGKSAKGNEFFVRYCEGNIGKAKELLNDDDFNEMRNELYNSILSILKDDRYSIYEAERFILDKKDKWESISSLFAMLIRDVLFKRLSLTKYILNTATLAIIEKFSKKMTELSCINVIEIIDKTRKSVGANGNFDLCVCAMLINSWEEIHGRCS